MATSKERRDFIAASQPDLRPMEYFAEMGKPHEKEELTPAQEQAAEKLSFLKQDPQASQADLASAKGAVDFNQATSTQKTPAKEQQQAQAGENKERPEPQLKPEHAKGKNPTYEEYANNLLDRANANLSDREKGQQQEKEQSMGM